MFLEKKDVDRKGPFPCPCCHKLLRAQRNKIATNIFAWSGLLGATLSFLGIGYSSHGIRDLGGLVILFGAALDLVFRWFGPNLEIEPAEGGRLLFS
jgi:hypothetical protein